MSASRRDFLSAVVATAAAPRAPELRAPNLADDQVVRAVAGIRPYRRGGPRLEREELAGKIVVHNYGHGGAGYTLSWGSASGAADLLRGLAPGTKVAVLGAGVVGLTTALVLLERGFRARVVARDFPPHTTSDVAGAEWSPDIVERGDTPALRARFDAQLATSWRRFQSLVGARWGVAPRPIYEADDVPSGLDELPPGLLPAPERVALPFARKHRARVYRTLLIEAPLFLATLAREVRRAGGLLERGELASPRDLRALPEPAVVNCLGVGAGAVFSDRAVVPIRGQLVHLKPQPLGYLLDHPTGYVVPRADALVLGGSFEEGVADARTDPATVARILEENRRFFRR
jgi:glycine/D-amino acid oxidase-like deaminating enzyme